MLVQSRRRRKPKLTVGEGWRTFRDDKSGERTVLFWSGGKDSFLTLRALQKRHSRGREGRDGRDRITLLTTFDGKTGNIPFQDTKVRGNRLWLRSKRSRTWHVEKRFRSRCHDLGRARRETTSFFVQHVCGSRCRDLVLRSLKSGGKEIPP